MILLKIKGKKNPPYLRETKEKQSNECTYV